MTRENVFEHEKRVDFGVNRLPSDFSHTVSGYVPTVPGTVGDWENCMAQSYVPVRNSDPLMQSETSSMRTHCWVSYER